MKEAQKMEKLEKFYSLVLSSAQTPPPKYTLFGAKCPKCGSKLSKETVKETIYAGEGATEFGNKVIIKDAGAGPGLYNLHIDNFSCKCGYQFGRRTLETPADTSA